MDLIMRLLNKKLKHRFTTDYKYPRRPSFTNYKYLRYWRDQADIFLC